MSNLSDTETNARGRFYVLSAVRLFGAISVLLGMLTASGNSDWPVWIGYILLIEGLFNFFVVPPLLAKLWRTPD